MCIDYRIVAFLGKIQYTNKRYVVTVQILYVYDFVGSDWMGRTVAIGIQDFGKIRENNCFYVDKTDFIKEWWEYKDDVTLITRQWCAEHSITFEKSSRMFKQIGMSIKVTVFTTWTDWVRYYGKWIWPVSGLGLKQ